MHPRYAFDLADLLDELHAQSPTLELGCNARSLRALVLTWLLLIHCRQVLASDPMSGAWFVFINRARTMIRVLVYDGSGFWLMTKRLSTGRFQGWPTGQEAISPMAAKTLMQVLQAQRAPLEHVAEPASRHDTRAS